MKIKIDHFIEGAKKATGLAVIIDVFRACSVMCYVAKQNPAEYLISNDREQLEQLKLDYPNGVFIGKNHPNCRPIFNVNNSPTEINRLSLKSKKVIHNSEGGINGLLSASNTTEVITGGFTNAKAVVAYIKYKKPEKVSIICMGHLGKYSSKEDELCARYIVSLIKGNPLDSEAIIKDLKSGSGALFFKKDNYLPEQDFYLCLDFNQFDFILQLNRKESVNKLIKIETH